MNTNDKNGHGTSHRDADQRSDAPVSSSDGLTDTLSKALSALRTDEQPEVDLWPGIAARLTRDSLDAVDVVPVTTASVTAIAARTPAATVPGAGRRSARSPVHRAWTLPVALAASVALALAVGWQLQQHGEPGADAAGAPLIAHAATAMTREYRAAFAAVDARPLPAREARTIAQLDRTAADVRAALKQAPESRLLLTQLKRVYARRLDLSQRFARMS